MNMSGLLLVGISGICWTIVYIELIRNGIKDKACGMPIFALGLNIVWELLYSVDGFFISKEFIMIQNVADFVWALCDVFLHAGLSMAGSTCRKMHKSILFHLQF